MKSKMWNVYYKSVKSSYSHEWKEACLCKYCFVPKNTRWIRTGYGTDFTIEMYCSRSLWTFFFFFWNNTFDWRIRRSNVSSRMQIFVLTNYSTYEHLLCKSTLIIASITGGVLSSFRIQVRTYQEKSCSSRIWVPRTRMNKIRGGTCFPWLFIISR